MKKNRKQNMVLPLLMLSLLLTACAQAGNGGEGTVEIKEKMSREDYKRVQMMTGYNIYTDLTGLEKASELVVVGTFVSEPQQELKYNGPQNAGVLNGATSFTDVRIDQVLKGDVKVGDTIQVSQSYGYVDETQQLLCFSYMTPMVEGDRWIFFLGYSEEAETYWSSGDYTGRYPVPEDLSAEALALLQAEDIATSKEKQDAFLKLIQPEDFGVYEASNINLKLYLELLEQYNLKFVNIGN